MSVMICLVVHWVTVSELQGGRFLNQEARRRPWVSIDQPGLFRLRLSPRGSAQGCVELSLTYFEFLVLVRYQVNGQASTRLRCRCVCVLHSGGVLQVSERASFFPRREFCRDISVPQSIEP